MISISTKNFDKWFPRKKRLQQRDGPIHFREGEVWWCSLGVNLGTEMDGKNDFFERPVIILRRFGDHDLVVVPTTSQKKVGIFYFSISDVYGMSITVLLSHPRFISNKRLLRQYTSISEEMLRVVKKAIVSLIYKIETPPDGGESRGSFEQVVQEYYQTADLFANYHC